jgi:hypothetical protein
MSETHKYIPRIPQREGNLFLEEYYSGTDTKIYMDDNEQTEIGYISYSVQEQLKPIYGYASRTFDDVSVGNRIVTGMFKMPIKNPEDQASYETVIGAAMNTIEEIENNNQQQENTKNQVEWINNSSNSSSSVSSGYTNNQVFEYQNKLLKLGYNASTSGTLDAQTRSAIKQFQQDQKLTQSSYFNNDTMIEIDASIELLKTPKGTTNSITNVYYGLSTAMGIVTTLQAGEEFYIINDLGNGFTQIRTVDSKDGYIETSRIA